MKTTAQFNALKEENKKLRDELDDYHNTEKFVLGDDCPTDEVHCGCVVILKKQIKGLEAGQLNFAKEMDRIHSNNLKRIEELKQLLIEYGRHSPGCTKQWNKKYPCRCGWDREKQALKG